MPFDAIFMTAEGWDSSSRRARPPHSHWLKNSSSLPDSFSSSLTEASVFSISVNKMEGRARSGLGTM